MRVFTTGEVSRICRVAPSTVSKWFDTGQLKGYRVPGSQHRRIPRQSLVQFLKDHNMPLGDLEHQAGARLLLVGRDKSLLESLCQALEHDRHFSVTIVSSGFEAGIQADAVRPDCVIVDFSLGDVEATQLCRNLRRAPQFGHTTIIALLPPAGAAAEVDQARFTEAFTKPFDPALLAKRLQRLVGDRIRLN